MNSFNTAITTHSKCCICKLQKVKLRLIKKESIAYAFIRHKIIIKYGSRCCLSHLDENFQIKKELFNTIPVKLQPYNKDTVSILNSKVLSWTKSGIFDKFRDIYLLDEEECLKVTGWTKIQFIEFCKYIKSCYDTNGRTREQLVAIYRYWLRKGIDQASLAMFKDNCNQRLISFYLAQIRQAMNKDFVPFFLGCKKDRQFYLSHNNETTINLNNLDRKKDLAVFADATYTRLEKSSNNEFQYFTWSSQKKDLLIKPFIICCADGYIIDIYGPFRANMNDASIFEYILKTDVDLTRLLEPGNTVLFLDRGFRDIYYKLIDEYNFKVLMPFCHNLKRKKKKNYDEIYEESETDEEEEEKSNKYLTTQQTSDTRLVTKVRYIIESQNGNLKNKESLENIRNTVAGHIMIDYRIAGAMINFTHKPICSDGKNAAKVAIKIREKAVYVKQKNYLECILKKRLDTSQIPYINILSISDFPKMNKKQLKNKIFFGTYQFRMCKSYLNELVKNGRFYYLTSNALNGIKNPDLKNKLTETETKIIAAEISSRHKRGTKKSVKSKNENQIKRFKVSYKVFLQYSTVIENYRSIKRYICSCQSGRKIAGCCVHVATLIYYLSYAKYRPLENPAEHLNNIFVNTDSLEQPNKPRYVKGKRRFKTKPETSDSVSSSSEQETERNIKLGNVKENEKNTDDVILLENKSNDNFLDDLVENEEVSMNVLKEHIPFWGATINYKSQIVRVYNTCPIDNFLFALWKLYKAKNNIFDNYPNESLRCLLMQIVSEIDKLNWDLAKELWINNVMSFDEKIDRAKSISLYGAEDIRFLNYLKEYQTYNLIQKCDQLCSKNGKPIALDNDLIHFIKTKKGIEFYSTFNKTCIECKTKINREIAFNNNPNFIFVQTINKSISVSELPKSLNINNIIYNLFFATIFKPPDHFQGVFLINNRFYLFDALDQSCVLYEEKSEIKNRRKSNVSSVLYLKKIIEW